MMEIRIEKILRYFESSSECIYYAKQSRTNTDRPLSDRSSASAKSRYSVSKDDGYLKGVEVLQQKEETSYTTEEEDWFDPRDPNLYKYYKDRHARELNYKNMPKVLGKFLLGGGEEVDSQIGSMDSYSQVGDTLSTNDSGIMSMQDSGISRDMSDTYSYMSHKASPLIREKIHSKAGSYKSRVDSRRKRNLSPVKSSSTIGSGKTTPRDKEPDWMKFFQTPTALERKRMEMVKKDFSEGRMKPGSSAVINYISDNLPTLPGEAGLRLLKSVRVGRAKALEHDEERHHKIEPIPGKLGVHTKDENKGQSKYGILQMQWTTAVPIPISQDKYPQSYSPMSDGSTVETDRAKSRLPSIIQKYGNSARQDLSTQNVSTQLPGVYSPDYEWEYPIPPPPAKESRISIPYIKKEHEKYCKYYTLVKKKMQNYSSKAQDHTITPSLPKVEIKKAIQERLKLPKELSRVSRIPSVLFPPITLNQLISART